MSVRLGDWDCTLSKEQLQYSALDAYAGLILYQTLEELSHHIGFGKPVPDVEDLSVGQKVICCSGSARHDCPMSASRTV